MSERWTTRCCTAIALVLAAAAVLDAKSTAAPAPSFFPARPIWTLDLNNALTAPPALAGDTAYFPIEGDRIAAYDVWSGDQQWIANVGTKLQPATGDGLIFIAASDAIVALREADGSEAWRQPVVNSIVVPLVWDNHWLVAADTSGNVHAFRAVDGRLIWQQNVGAQLHAAPALAADRVYVATVDDRLVALSVETGAIAWNRRLGGTPNDILALDDRVYVGANDNFLYCVNADRGAIAWRWRTGGDVVGKPIADASHVYFVSLDNVLRSLSLRSGAQAWKRALPFRPIAGPIQLSSTVVVAGLSPVLHGFAVKDGAPGNDVTMTAELAAPPLIVSAGSRPAPLMIVVTRDFAKGAAAVALTRSLEPQLSATIQLPNAPLPKLAEPTPVSTP